MAPRPSRSHLLPLLVLLAVLLTACQSGNANQGEEPALALQTEPELGIADAGESGIVAGGGDGSALVDADFADIPLPSAAEPFDMATVIDSVIVQNFTVTATSASEVLAHFNQVLPAQGWDRGRDTSTGEDAEGTGAEQLQSTWVRQGKTLLISTADSGEAGTQLSLQLSGG